MKIDNQRNLEVQDQVLENLERRFIAGRLDRRSFIRAAVAAGVAVAGLPALADE